MESCPLPSQEKYAEVDTPRDLTPEEQAELRAAIQALLVEGKLSK
jgi:hypothetical protein